MRQLFLAFSLLLLTSCEEPSDFQNQPISDVGAKVLIADFEALENDSLMVHFSFEFDNNSKQSINFDVSKVSMLVNGKNPIAIHYNSLASDPWPSFELPKGYSKHKLYALLEDEVLGEDELISYVIVNIGLAKNE